MTYIRRIHEECLIPPDVVDFEFPFFLPPDMSRDRLGRCLVMGIAEVDLETHDFDAVMSIADGALSAAQDAGMGQICLFSSESGPVIGEPVIAPEESAEAPDLIPFPAPARAAMA